MAEFQEVMTQANRMCFAFSECNKCPLLSKNTHECRLRVLVTMFFSSACCSEIENLENIIVEWAKKNPAPRYPTYREHVLKAFPTLNPMYIFGRCLCDLYGSDARPSRCDGVGHHDISCQSCWNREMAAKVAKEVGAEKKQHLEE